jgi:gliding motility associated protien GldN
MDDHPVPKQHVRMDDVLWMKTVWQRIDLREKNNQSLYFPENPSQHRSALFDLIVSAVYDEPVLKAYDLGPLGTNDMFDRALTKAELEQILIKRDTVRSESIFEEGVWENTVEEDRIASTDVIAYDIKEHWFIDRNRSVMEARIVGICPVVAVYDDQGSFKGTKRLFWLYYPELIQQLAQWPAYNRHNDVEAMSYARYFDDHRFSGYITKISNVYDRNISSYLAPEEALVKGMETKEYIRNMEQDMWNY